jgi:hypothetical protein
MQTHEPCDFEDDAARPQWPRTALCTKFRVFKSYFAVSYLANNSAGKLGAVPSQRIVPELQPSSQEKKDTAQTRTIWLVSSSGRKLPVRREVLFSNEAQGPHKAVPDLTPYCALRCTEAVQPPTRACTEPTMDACLASAVSRPQKRLVRAAPAPASGTVYGALP